MMQFHRVTGHCCRQSCTPKNCRTQIEHDQKAAHMHAYIYIHILYISFSATVQPWQLVAVRHVSQFDSISNSCFGSAAVSVHQAIGPPMNDLRCETSETVWNTKRMRRNDDRHTAYTVERGRKRLCAHLTNIGDV